MVKYQAALFDFNGVILWDRKWHEEAWNELSESLRRKPLTQAEHEEQVHGRTPGETLEFLLGRKATSQEFTELLNRKETLYQKIALASHDFRLSMGASALFDLLAHHHIPQTIATSSPLINVQFYYQHLGLEKWFPFDQIVYDDGSFPGKPAPDIYLKAAEKVGVDISSCVVVEDAKSGIVAAKTAGAGKIIAIATLDNTATQQDRSVDKIVENLSQITLADFE